MSSQKLGCLVKSLLGAMVKIETIMGQYGVIMFKKYGESINPLQKRCVMKQL
jgi:hypothetical protein